MFVSSANKINSPSVVELTISFIEKTFIEKTRPCCACLKNSQLGLKRQALRSRDDRLQIRNLLYQLTN